MVTPRRTFTKEKVMNFTYAILERATVAQSAAMESPPQRWQRERGPPA
jgi:hypothetical protein